jgi:ferric-dicitrate binding protein FerR (iron transport regulator)
VEAKHALAEGMTWAGERRTSRRIERLDRANERLKAQNAALHREFEETRSIQRRMLDALEHPPVVKVKRRRRGLVGSLLIGAGACLVGMRLGRDRYEHLAAWAKDRFGQVQSEQVVDVSDAGAQELARTSESESDPSPTTVGSGKTPTRGRKASAEQEEGR